MLMHPNIDPVALSLGPVQVHWYGLTYLVAFGLFYLLAALRARQPWHAENHADFIIADPDGNLLLFAGRTD